jgi:hypothetical protein
LRDALAATRLFGDQALAQKAKEAVRQWQFKPFLEHGDPVAVETVIDFGTS